MSVALICWGRFFDKHGNKVTVPAPSDGEGFPWLADTIASKASDIAAAGFDVVQWPPLSKALGGTGAGCDGYGVFDRRDLGSKNQQGSLPTRYGSAEQVRRAMACLRANGVDSYLDLVLHQLTGENGGPGVFRYFGAHGAKQNGRGGTSPGWFRGNTGNNDPVPPFCPEDDVPSVFFDYAFGRELSYQHCNPHRVTTDDALDFGDWIFRTTGAAGARFDDVKGTWSPFVHEFMTSRAMAGKDFYSEYFDGDPSILDSWVTSAPMNSRSAVEDFTNHWAIQTACDGGNARALDRAGYSNLNPGSSVVFVDNPDTDTSPGQQVSTAKLLGYAFLFTIPSKMILVYGKDYFPASVWPGSYGLKPWIDNLIYINNKYAYGSLFTRYVDNSVIVLNRDGDGGGIGHSPGLLTALNFDTYNRRTITCDTAFGPHAHLHDLTGHHEDIWTAGDGSATFTIPSNAWNNGQSYLCFSAAGFDSDSARRAQIDHSDLLWRGRSRHPTRGFSRCHGRPYLVRQRHCHFPE